MTIPLTNLFLISFWIIALIIPLSNLVDHLFDHPYDQSRMSPWSYHRSLSWLSSWSSFDQSRCLYLRLSPPSSSLSRFLHLRGHLHGYLRDLPWLVSQHASGRLSVAPKGNHYKTWHGIWNKSNNFKSAVVSVTLTAMSLRLPLGIPFLHGALVLPFTWTSGYKLCMSGCKLFKIWFSRMCRFASLLLEFGWATLCSCNETI